MGMDEEADDKEEEDGDDDWTKKRPKNVLDIDESPGNFFLVVSLFCC